MDKILSELGANFGLSGKEQLIIEALLKGKAAANKISKDTSIPLGRIYDFLNNLITLKLIERSEKKPFNYFITNLDENIVDFLKLNFEQAVQKQNRMMYLLEHRSKNFDEIEIISSGDDFSFRTIQLVKESRYFKNTVRHGSTPFALYPEKSADFLKVRKIITDNRNTLSHTTPEMTFMIYRTHDEAYKKGKKMEYIVEKSALNFHLKLIRKKLGSKFYNNMIKQIKERIDKYNISIYVIDEPIPIQMLVTDKKVFLSVIHQGHTQGLLITNDSAVELYTNYFEEMKERCKPLMEFI